MKRLQGLFVGCLLVLAAFIGVATYLYLFATEYAR